MDAVNLEDLTPVSAKDANPWGVDVNQLEEINEGTSVDMVGVGSIEPVQQKKQTAQYGDAALVNLFSEQEVADLEKKGKIGFAELAMRQKTGDILPFSPTGIVDSVKLISASNRIKANEYTDDKQRDDDTALITAYGRRKAEEYVRGFTWGAKAYDITSKMPAFAIETAVGIGIAKRAGMYAATKAGEAIAKKTALRKTAEIAGTTAIATAIQPNRYIAKYADQMVTEDLAITDHGIDIMRVAEKEPAKAFMIAIGDTAIENFSEIYGGAFIGKGAGFIGAKLPKKFTEEFAKAYAKIKPTGSVADLMSNAGWHGALEEFGEERLADLLRAVTGVDERDISFFDKVSQALFPSAEDALVELGVFATIGAGSAYTQRVVNDLRSRGMSEEDIQRQVDAKSEKERIEWSKTITDRYTVEKYREDLKEKFGLTEEEVTAQVILTDQIAKSKGISTEDYVGAYIAGIEEGKEGEQVEGLAQEDQTLIEEARKYKSAEEFVNASSEKVFRGSGSGKGSGVDLFGSGTYYTNDINEAKYYGNKISETLLKNSDFFDGTKVLGENELKEITDGIDKITKSKIGSQYFDNVVSWYEGDVPKNLISFKRVIDELGTDKKFFDASKKLGIKQNQLNPDADIANLINKALESKGYKGAKFRSDEIESLVDEGLGKGTAYIVWGKETDVRKELADIWNKAHGNVLGQDVKGTVTFGEDGRAIIRAFSSADISTAIHELAHIARRTALSPEEQKTVARWAGALSESGEIVWTVPAEEKFARGFERYLLDNKKPAKGLEDIFNKISEWLKTIYANLASVDVAISPAVSKVFDRITSGKEYIAPLKGRDGMLKAYQDVINQFSSIEQIDGKKGKNPLYAVRQFLGTKGIVESIINDGTVDVSGIKIEKNGEGLKNIVDDFISRSSAIEEDSQVAMEDLQRWLIAQRTLDNMTKEDVYVSDEQKQEAVEDIAYIADKYASDMPVIEETAKRIYDFQHRILEMFVQSGMKSKEWFDEVTKAHPHYVPFKRVFEEDELSDVSGVGARFSDVKTGIKQLKGSDRQIENVFESIIKNVYTTTNKALRNRVAVNVAKLKKEFPMLMRSAKPKLVMDENGNVVGAEKPAGNIIEYYTKGERHWLEVTDDLYDALGSLATAQDKGVLELITNILSVPAQTLRVGATITPEFFVRNFIRDSYGAAIQTNFGFNPVVDPAFGLASVLKKDEMYYRWLRSGGAYSGLVDIGKESMKSAVAELTKDPSLIERLNIIGHLEAMSMAVERANRVGLFRSALKSGMSEMEASYQSREGTLDFGVKGSKTAKLNQMIAFFNARIQGADKFIRTAKEDPVGTTLRSLMWVTAPQLAFYALAYFSGDDEYFDIPRWQRDMFYIIKIGDIHYRIPKPFVYGQLFGSTVERFLDYVRENDPNEFKEMMNMIWDSLSPTSDIQSVLPTALAPLIEDATNYSFFRGMSLYPEYKEKMMPYMQYGKGTSLTSQIIGEKFNLSPAKIDNIVSGYFGTSGKYATNATDFLAREIKKAKGETVAERPMDIQDAPVLRGFMVPQVTGYKSESVNKLMDKAREIDKIRLTISAEKKAGRRDKAEELSKEHKKELRAYKVIDNAQKAIKELDKNNTAIAKKDYDMKKKREIIDRNEKQMTQKAKKALALYKSMMQ
jgi:hypothetical protein